MSTKGKRLYQCDDCKRTMFFHAVEMGRRTRPRCHYCGCGFLNPHSDGAADQQANAGTARKIIDDTDPQRAASAHEAMRDAVPVRRKKVNLADILALLQRYESRMTKIGRHDNMRVVGLWLRLYGDGSGQVMGDYRQDKPEYADEQHMVATVMSEPTSLHEFDTLEDLHGFLVAQTMNVRRQAEGGAT